MNRCWHLSITFSVPMEICLSPSDNVMNYIDLIVYQFYWDKLYPFLYIVSIEWALCTLNLFSSSIYSKLLSAHSDYTLGGGHGAGERRGPCLPCGEWAECPQIWAPVGSGFYLLLKLEFMKYCAPDFKSWRVILVISLRNPVYPSLPICDIKDSVSLQNLLAQWCRAGSPWAGWWLRGPVSPTSLLHMPQPPGDLAPMGRGPRGPTDREVGPCWDLGLRHRLWEQPPQHRPERGRAICWLAHF